MRLIVHRLGHVCNGDAYDTAAIARKAYRLAAGPFLRDAEEVSEHDPIYLLIMLLMPWRQRTLRVRYALHALCLVLLVAFPIVSLLVGQVINASVYLIALSLALLSLGRLLNQPTVYKYVQEPTGAA